MAKKPLTHVPVSYPALEDGLHSAQHALAGALGREEMSLGTLAAHGWVATGTALDQLLPADGPMMAAKMAEKLTPEERKTLEGFLAMKADPAQKVDWKALLNTFTTVILPLILKLLACVVLLLLLTGTAQARPPQAPRPPQCPVAVNDVVEPECRCGGGCSELCTCGCQDVKAKPSKKKVTRRYLAPPVMTYHRPIYQPMQAHFGGGTFQSFGACSGGG